MHWKPIVTSLFFLSILPIRFVAAQTPPAHVIVE
jgi:hypothetical protein